MTQNEHRQSVLTKAIQYRYIIESKDKSVELEVEDRDVFRNADDEIDCPLDVVLRKNGYSLNDLMSWDAREIQFVKIIDQEIVVINRVSLNVNL
ncbi:hypothetical protein [Alkalibacterium olivapovliticus]|uniref:Uncharacterized protein n=1 Tax=Alkalibacterium olivapovliticus TaxID=99907 RepID=A0A2T0VUQ4_9LACT|nr:hypothetical protein [Alkalibacterium olivapovliticus]PRY75184.1 hypothetical protein CLV38_13617 [Alkalibacterium olivapovliticus]